MKQLNNDGVTRRRGHNDGTIYERKDKSGRVIGYQGQVSVPGGKRRSFSGKTKRDVREKMKATERLAAEGRLGNGSRDTVKQYLEQWLEMARPGLRPRTYEVYELNVRLRLVPHLGGTRLAMLTPQQVQTCYSALLTSGLSARSVQQAHLVLHKALRDAVRLDVIPRNCSEGATVPRPVRTEMKTLNVEQLQRLLAATRDDRFQTLWVVLPLTGLRIGEALGLKWQDIDMERQTLTIQRALQRQKGRGLVFVPPKTARSRRTIEVPSTVITALRGHRERQRGDRDALGDAYDDHDLVFCTGMGTPLDRDRIHRHWRPALQRANLPYIRLHDLRHTAASLMRQEGVDVEVVQRTLGHSNIAVTLDIYTHVGTHRYRDAADRMDALVARRAEIEQRPPEDGQSGDTVDRA